MRVRVCVCVQLPDGRVVKLGGERFEAPEILFQPHLINIEGAGMAEMLFNTIQVGGASQQRPHPLHYSLCTGSRY